MGLKESDKETKEPAPKRGTELSTKISASISIAAALVLAVMIGIYASRHYKRWDLTKGGIFTLSAASVETLHKLPEPVKIIVLLGEGDPLKGMLDQMLVGYRAESQKLDIVYIDPDKDRADFLAVQEKYDLSSGRTQDGRVLSDAAVIVAHGDRHEEILPGDLISYDAADNLKATPRVEQALTGAILAVFETDKPVVCVTQGHGEHALDEGGQLGLAYFRERLKKNDYEVQPVFGEPDEKDSLAHCNVLVLAGPQEPLPPEEVKAITTFIEKGGGALLVVSPLPSQGDPPWFDVGLDPILKEAGVALQNGIIFEQDAAARMPTGHGETFLGKIESHAVTAGIEHEQARGLGVIVQVAGPLKDLKSDVTPTPLLKTSDKAFGLVDFASFAQTMTDPKKTDADFSGPLTIATATERPKVHAEDEHGARIVVIASFSALFGRNWSEPPFRGTSRFVESAVSWIASHRAFLDIPQKPASAVGIRLTQDGLDSIMHYVLGVIPVISVTFGVLVFFARRRRPAQKPAAGEGGA